MRKCRLYLLIIISSFFLFACEENNTKTVGDLADKDKGNETSNLVNDKTSEKNTSEEDAQESNKDTTLIDIDYIKENIKIGLTKEEVKTLIGDPDFEGLNIETDNTTWRYDIGGEDDYVTPLTEFEKENGIIDNVNIDGLMNNTINMQLFVGWYDDRVDHISCYYVKNENINEYRVFNDGTVREMNIK
ncbi:hypothetical protein GCM10011351_17960 [Paraliobacillus quinghaiensis]|uniref:Lipoprotein n=1 Tax=Paraliobacillus quinghaiensis TaxID=470815 RepID=A0A917TPS2_9BACI|nr:hypothetical protein [Paraliobacillus quinghaiensis]GGM32305.1 hypothetical protein GCM10011351_17960 [Paraliobacillus quinghaiensis]